MKVRLMLILFAFSIIGCKDEETTPECETNATIFHNTKDGTSQLCMKASRFQHQISRENAESYYVYVDQVGVNFEIRVNPGKLMEQGEIYEPGFPYGAAIYSGQWGSTEFFELLVLDLDRENMLVSFAFQVRATALNSGATKVNYDGILKDLPLTAVPNP